MPSFTRRMPAGSTAAAASTASSVPAALLPGCVPSPGSSSSSSSASSHSSPSLSLLPTGIPSLDDLLGGGLPLGGTLLALSTDLHSAWGRLVARYWAAQALVSGQEVVVLGERELAGELVRGCMWVDERGGGTGHGTGNGNGSESEGEGAAGDVGQGRGGGRIAWRYDTMGKFQTSTGRSSHLTLMKTIPAELVRTLERTGGISYISIPDDCVEQGDKPGCSGRGLGRSETSTSRLDAMLGELVSLLDKKGKGKAVRIVVNELGGDDWSAGGLTSSETHRFLHSLRQIARTRPCAALVTLPPHLVSAPPRKDPSVFPTAQWLKSLAWASDACIELRGFADNPALAPHFAPLHGLLELHAYPTTHTVLPATLRHSALLGVSQSATNERGGGGAGENNLGFRVKRKGLVIETAHLGIEGGSGERRTQVEGGEVGEVLGVGSRASSKGAAQEGLAGAGSAETASASATEGVDRPQTTVGKPKAKKSVRIQFDEKSLEF